MRCRVCTPPRRIRYRPGGERAALTSASTTPALNERAWRRQAPRRDTAPIVRPRCLASAAGCMFKPP